MQLLYVSRLFSKTEGKKSLLMILLLFLHRYRGESVNTESMKETKTFLSMKKIKIVALLLVAGFVSLSCGGGNDGDRGIDDPLLPVNPTLPADSIPTDSIFTDSIPTDSIPTDSVLVPDTVVVAGFAKGADVGWLTEMEADGVKFYNAGGEATECLSLLKQSGMNAVRLRVWVNPEKRGINYCNLSDVLVKAQRAHALGMDIMIDFHYSDFFADPSRQDKPAAWASMSEQGLKEAVATHTKEVLQALKAKEITPRWVQVGNETRNGMLWPAGQLWDNSGNIDGGWENYVALHNAGYDAAKSIFPETIVIVHIDNAWDDQNWWFKEFRKKGGKMDMIGLSHYPQTHDTKTWQEMNDLAINHIELWAKTYGVEVMVCEVGVKPYQEALAATVIKDFVSRAKDIEQCAGVFYWEPQVYGGWKPAVYASLGWTAYDMGAFRADGRPSTVMDAFKD